MRKDTELSTDNKILMHLHCQLCLIESQEKFLSPKDYQSIEVGWTKFGLQVWCKRHNCNVLSIDFEGQKHPAIVKTPIRKDGRPYLPNGRRSIIRKR